MKHEVTSLNTKRTLASALKNIMKKKSFSKITVSEIIAESGLNRKTFYYHFNDIYDLLKWVFENEAIEVVKQYNLLVDYEEAIIFVMNYIEDNDYIISCTYDAIGRDEMKHFLFDDFEDIIACIITNAEKETNTTLDEAYKKFLCLFYTEALAGVIIDWTKNHRNRNKQEVIDYIVNTIKGSLLGILTNTTNLKNCTF